MVCIYYAILEPVPYMYSCGSGTLFSSIVKLLQFCVRQGDVFINFESLGHD